MECRWYKTACPEEKCDGEGYVSSRLRNMGVTIDRIRGEYGHRKGRGPKFLRTKCSSFREKESELATSTE